MTNESLNSSPAEAFRRVNDGEARVRLSIRAALLDAYILSRQLTGAAVTTAEDVGRLDLMLKHLVQDAPAPLVQP